MKFFKLCILLWLLILTSCASTNFNKRKFTKGHFKAPHKNYKAIKTGSELNAELPQVIDATKKLHKKQSKNTNKQISNASQKSKNRIIKSTINKTSNETGAIQAKHLHQFKVALDDTVYIESNNGVQSEANKSKRKGTASLILGILSLVFPYFPLTLVAAIISLILARGSLKSKYQTEKGRKRAKIGRILSLIGIGIIALGFTLLLFLFAFAFFF